MWENGLKSAWCKFNRIQKLSLNPYIIDGGVLCLYYERIFYLMFISVWLCWTDGRLKLPWVRRVHIIDNVLMLVFIPYAFAFNIYMHRLFFWWLFITLRLLVALTVFAYWSMYFSPLTFNIWYSRYFLWPSVKLTARYWTPVVGTVDFMCHRVFTFGEFNRQLQTDSQPGTDVSFIYRTFSWNAFHVLLPYWYFSFCKSMTPGFAQLCRKELSLSKQLICWNVGGEYSSCLT